MIARFLASKFSGYLALALAVALLASHAYVYAYGYGQCKEDQDLADGDAAKRQVSSEVSIAKELQQKNREVDKDENRKLDDMSIVINAINRL